MWYIDLQVLLICCFMPPAGRCEAVSCLLGSTAATGRYRTGGWFVFSPAARQPALPRADQGSRAEVTQAQLLLALPLLLAVLNGPFF